MPAPAYPVLGGAGTARSVASPNWRIVKHGILVTVIGDDGERRCVAIHIHSLCVSARSSTVAAGPHKASVAASEQNRTGPIKPTIIDGVG